MGTRVAWHRTLRAVVAAAIALTGMSSNAQDYMGVTVEVAESAGADGYTYSYRVTNDLVGERISALIIGENAHGNWLLVSTPVGWTLDGGLPATSVASPQGWEPAFEKEEEGNHTMSWRSPTPATDIYAGLPSEWFRITVNKPDPAYSANGSFVVAVIGGGMLPGRLKGATRPPP